MLKCKRFDSQSTGLLFVGNTLGTIFEIDEVYHRGTYPLFQSGTVKVKKYDSNQALIGDGSGLATDISGEELVISTNTTWTLSSNKTIEFPFKRVTGTGSITTTAIALLDVGKIECDATITFIIGINTVVTGKSSPYFLGKLQMANGATFNGFFGRIEALSSSASYGIGFNIFNSTVLLNGSLISSNASFAWPAITVNLKDVEFVQTTPNVLFTGFNSGSFVNIKKTGFLKTNGTLGSNGINILLTDTTPNNYGEQNFASFPNTRNDGGNPTNKLLGTDASGNLKMYNMALMPAPYIDIVVPDSTLPNTTGNFELYGSFFTPTMTVVFTGQTVNYVTFRSSNWVTVNVRTGANEGLFNIILDNGISKTFVNTYQVVLGTIFKPLSGDWINVNNRLDISNGDKAKITNYGLQGIGTWNKEFNYTKDFSLQFKYALSPLGTPFDGTYKLVGHLINALDDSWIMSFGILYQASVAKLIVSYSESSSTYVNSNFNLNIISDPKSFLLEYRWIGGIGYMYANGTMRVALTKTLTANCKFKVITEYQDVTDIKYIELAT
jgi:hypothetical protein